MASLQTSRAGRPKSEEKRQLILTAASELFLSQGFASTSMDNVAKRSGVSKQTVYSHFENKDVLYTSAIENKCKAYQLDKSLLTANGGCSLSLKACLYRIGIQILRLLQDPEVIAMYRIVIAEATNNRHVAELFYQAGPKASIEVIGDLFFQASDHKLSAAQSEYLAIDFFSLLKGDLQMLQLLDLEPALDDETLDKMVSRAVRKTLILFDAEQTSTIVS